MKKTTGKKKKASNKKPRKVAADTPAKRDVQAAQEKLEKLAEEATVRNNATKQFHDELKSLIAKHRSVLTPFEAPGVVSDIMLAFDTNDSGVDYRVGNWGVEKAINSYLAKKIAPYLPQLEKIHKHLVANKFTERRPWEYTIDGYAWYIPHESKTIFKIGRRSRNYLVIIEPGQLFHRPEPALHIRRVYDTPKPSKKSFKFDEMLVQFPQMFEDLTDNVADNAYVSKPDMLWFAKKNFELQYKDFRDPGYVLTLGHYLMGYEEIEGSLGAYPSIKDAFFWIEIILDQLEANTTEQP